MKDRDHVNETIWIFLICNRLFILVNFAAANFELVVWITINATDGKNHCAIANLRILSNGASDIHEWEKSSDFM